VQQRSLDRLSCESMVVSYKSGETGSLMKNEDKEHERRREGPTCITAHISHAQSAPIGGGTACYCGLRCARGEDTEFLVF
jgi:hypothetical protein